MAERITQDPHLDVMPDHAGPNYDVLRNALTQGGLTIEQAIQAINDSWTRSHDDRIQRWDQQVIDDANAADEAQRLLQEEEEQRLALEQQERENERKEAEKKKPKMNDFNKTAIVDSYIAPRPSQYALRRIEEFEYVELWYLTPEGCADAANVGDLNLPL